MAKSNKMAKSIITGANLVIKQQKLKEQIHRSFQKRKIKLLSIKSLQYGVPSNNNLTLRLLEDAVMKNLMWGYFVIYIKLKLSMYDLLAYSL